MSAARPKLIFVVTEDWYFYSHRLPMVRAAQQAGFDVAVITNVTAHRAAIESAGVQVIPLSLERRSLNPLRALRHIAQLTAIYRRERPALVHHIAMKPVLYGAIAARLAGVPRMVSAFAGLGYVFNANTPAARVLRPVLLRLFRLVLRDKGRWLLFQNPDDQTLLARCGVAELARTRVIRGSGVDLDTYSAAPPAAPAPDFICVFAGRMIEIKGLPTLKEAFALLAEEAPQIKLWLCGQPDEDNPGSWCAADLRQWDADSDNVAYKGHCDDMVAIWRAAHLALQVSYGGEGVPKSLLEAAASGRAIIASDVPGCREMVEDGSNGFLVPPRDAAALAARIKRIAGDFALCCVMGLNSRALVESDLSAEAVSTQTAALYRLIMEEQV